MGTGPLDRCGLGAACSPPCAKRGGGAGGGARSATTPHYPDARRVEARGERIGRDRSSSDPPCGRSSARPNGCRARGHARRLQGRWGLERGTVRRVHRSRLCRCHRWCKGDPPLTRAGLRRFRVRLRCARPVANLRWMPSCATRPARNGQTGDKLPSKGLHRPTSRGKCGICTETGALSSPPTCDWTRIPLRSAQVLQRQRTIRRCTLIAADRSESLTSSAFICVYLRIGL